MLQRRDQEGLLIYPIIARPCDWTAVAWLSAMNLRPTDGKALTLFSSAKRDLAMAEISREIRESLGNGVEDGGVPEPISPSPTDDEIDRLLEQTEALSAELGTTKTGAQWHVRDSRQTGRSGGTARGQAS